jgi:hypothetical protein
MIMYRIPMESVILFYFSQFSFKILKQQNEYVLNFKTINYCT